MPARPRPCLYMVPCPTTGTRVLARWTSAYIRAFRYVPNAEWFPRTTFNASYFDIGLSRIIRGMRSVCRPGLSLGFTQRTHLNLPSHGGINSPWLDRDHAWSRAGRLARLHFMDLPEISMVGISMVAWETHAMVNWLDVSLGVFGLTYPA